MHPVRTRRPGFLTAILPLLALIGGLAWRELRQDRRQSPLALPAHTMNGEPNLMLWAWEVPEDLTALSPQKAGVAFLAREVFAGQGAQVRPRLQPLRVADGAWLMAVVRIQTTPDFVASPALQRQVANDVLAAAQLPNVRGLQVDFDATASQRDFYAGILRRIRAGLPAGMPLSITALVSWCGENSWLRTLPSGHLPVDEAVAMFFRMGGPTATRALASKDATTVAEPLCAASIGIATDETWPRISATQRLYVFRPGAWSAEDLARINELGYQGLKGLQGSRPAP